MRLLFSFAPFVVQIKHIYILSFQNTPKQKNLNTKSIQA